MGKKKSAKKKAPAKSATKKASAKKTGPAPVRLETGALIGETVSLVRQMGLRGVVISVAFAAPTILGYVIRDTTAVTLWLPAVTQVLVIGALTDLALKGTDRTAYQSVRAGFLRWFDLFVTSIAFQLVVMFSLLLLVVPGVMRYLSYFLIFPLLMDGQAMAVDSLGKSSSLMRGHRMQVLVSAILVLLPSLAVAGLVFLATQDIPSDPGQRALIPHMPSSPEARAWSAIAEFCYALALIPTVALPVVVYRRLRKPAVE